MIISFCCAAQLYIRLFISNSSIVFEILFYNESFNQVFPPEMGIKKRLTLLDAARRLSLLTQFIGDDIMAFGQILLHLLIVRAGYANEQHIDDRQHRDSRAHRSASHGDFRRRDA